MAAKKKAAAIFVIHGVDVSALFLLVTLGEHFWMGGAVFISSFAAIGLLVLAANSVPADLLHAHTVTPNISPAKIGVVGALFYTAVLFVEQLGISRVPAFFDLIFVVAVEALFLFYVQERIGHENNERQLITLAAGLVVPIATIGLIAELRLPLVLAADLAFGLFIWTLLQKYKGSTNGNAAVNSFS